MTADKYIGLILEEGNENYTVGYRETTDLQKLKKWKKEMISYSNVYIVRILKIEEIYQGQVAELVDAKTDRLV